MKNVFIVQQSWFKDHSPQNTLMGNSITSGINFPCKEFDKYEDAEKYISDMLAHHDTEFHIVKVYRKK